MDKSKPIRYDLRYNPIGCVDLVVYHGWINTYLLMPEDVELFFFIHSNGGKYAHYHI